MKDIEVHFINNNIVFFFEYRNNNNRTNFLNLFLYSVKNKNRLLYLPFHMNDLKLEIV